MILDLSFRRVLPLVFLATVIALPLSTFIQSGLVLKDDWVPLNPNFSFYSLFWWNPANRLGAINQNIDWLPFNEFYAALATAFGIETGAKLFVYALVLLYALAHYIAFSLYYRIVRMVQYSAMATVSSVVATTNPWTTSHLLSGHFPLIVGLALANLSFALIVHGYLSGFRKGLLVPTIVLGLALGDPRSIVVYLTMVLLISIVSFILIRGRMLGLSARLLKVAGFAILLNAFWFFPTLFSLSSILRSFSAQSIAADTNGLLVNSQITSTLRLHGYFWEDYDIGIYNIFPYSNLLHLLASTILVLVAIAPLGYWILVKRRSAGPALTMMTFFLLIYGFGVLMASNLATDLILALERIPIFYVIRDPNKLLYLGVVGLSFGSGLLVSLIANLHRFWRTTLVCLLMVLLILNGVPWFSPGFGGRYTPEHIPQEYYDADNWLSHNTLLGSRVLYLPIAIYISFTWGRVAADPQQFLSSVPVGNPVDSFQSAGGQYLNTANALLHDSSFRFLGHFLSVASVQYVVVRTDSVYPERGYDLLPAVNRQQDLAIDWHSGAIYIFENLALPRPEISISSVCLSTSLDGMALAPMLPLVLDNIGTSSAILPDGLQISSGDPSRCARMLDISQLNSTITNSNFLLSIPMKYFYLYHGQRIGTFLMNTSLANTGLEHLLDLPSGNYYIHFYLATNSQTHLAVKLHNLNQSIWSVAMDQSLSPDSALHYLSSQVQLQAGKHYLQISSDTNVTIALVAISNFSFESLSRNN